MHFLYYSYLMDSTRYHKILCNGHGNGNGNRYRYGDGNGISYIVVIMVLATWLANINLSDCDVLYGTDGSGDGYYKGYSGVEKKLILHRSFCKRHLTSYYLCGRFSVLKNLWTLVNITYKLLLAAISNRFNFE